MLLKIEHKNYVLLRHRIQINILAFSVFMLLIQNCIADELNLLDCAYFPQFKVLYKKLPKMKPIAAIQAIWDYENKYNNPAGCESDLILSLLEQFEKKLFYIKSDTNSIFSESLYRCFEFDPDYTICNGIIADDTAHYEMAGKRTLVVPKIRDIEIITKLPGASLIGVYQTTVMRIYNQKTVLKLTSNSGKLKLPIDFKGNILIAMYKTSKGNWPYRKVIWFF